MYKFNFSIDKFSKLISDSIGSCSENATKNDAELIYYYLSQKYSHSEIKQVTDHIDKILNQMSESEIHDILINFANYGQDQSAGIKNT